MFLKTRGRADMTGDGRGFTMVELLIATILLFILLTGVLFMFEFGLRNAKGIQVRSILNVEISNCMEKMVRQVRCAYCFLVPTVASPLTGNPLYFKGDVRGDGVERHIIFYKTAGDELYVRESTDGVTWADRRIARNVTNLSFTYYDSTGTSLGNAITAGNRMSIYRVEMSMTMQRSASPEASPTTIVKQGNAVIRCTLRES